MDSIRPRWIQAVVVTDGQRQLVVLESGPDDVLVRFTETLHEFDRIAVHRHVLVGGFAVMVRLATAHRVTEDLDAVEWTDDGTSDATIALLMQNGGVRRSNGVDLGDVHIDLIAVSDYDPDDLPDDVGDRMFVVAHNYALHTATECTIQTLRSDGSQMATADVLVATPAALVAMKFGVVQRRRGSVLHKRTSDVFDAFRLLLTHDRDSSIARELATAPDGLGRWCVDRARDLFDTNLAQTLRWLATGSPEMMDVSTTSLRGVGTLFADAIEAFLE